MSNSAHPPRASAFAEASLENALQVAIVLQSVPCVRCRFVNSGICGELEFRRVCRGLSGPDRFNQSRQHHTRRAAQVDRDLVERGRFRIDLNQQRAGVTRPGALVSAQVWWPSGASDAVAGVRVYATNLRVLATLERSLGSSVEMSLGLGGGIDWTRVEATPNRSRMLMRPRPRTSM